MIFFARALDRARGSSEGARSRAATWVEFVRERVAFEVLRATGLRRGDAVKVGRPHLRDGVIRINTEKTGERVAIAATDELLKAIAAGP